jgi:HEAT repeats
MKNFGLFAGSGAALAIALTACVQSAAAQSLAQRIARVTDGTARITFNVRKGLCGNGNSIRSGSGSTNWGNDYSRDVEWDDSCYTGPGRLVVERRSGETTGLRFYVGGRWRASTEATDLGNVAAPDVASYLVSLAQTATGDVGGKAIFPATIVDSANVWPAFLRIARDETRPRHVRDQAVFWLGQAAGDSATVHLSSLALDNGVDREVREQAVFALSQRPKDEGVPALISIARTNRDPGLRKKALFWLGQSHDPRAVDLFEELILKK